jgi:hypothetical protein
MESAIRAAKAKFDELGILLRNETSHAAANGRLNSGGHLINTRRIVTKNFKETCAAASIRIAEICGADAISYSDKLGEFLATLVPSAIETYTPAPGRGDPNMLQLATKQSIELTKDLTDIAAATADDLSLGIANGVNVAKQKAGINIYNRGEAAQFAINSPQTHQELAWDQSVTTNTLTQIMEALREVQAIVKEAPLSTDDTEQINDAILIIEREVETPTPNPGRTKRFLSALGKKLESVGIEVAAEVIKKLMIS